LGGGARSPYNHTHDERGLALFDEPISLMLMLRHFKTDWWGERPSAWDDEEVQRAPPTTARSARLCSWRADF